MKKQKIYYLPCKRVILDDNHIEYIAICLDKGKFPDDFGVKHFGKVIDVKPVKRKDINVPLSRNYPDELYYLFKVESWQDLEQQ